MKNLSRCLAVLLTLVAGTSGAKAVPWLPQLLEETATEGGRVQYLNFGKFDQWLVRNIKESGIIGGKTKTIYAIAPNGTWNNNNPYNGLGGSPWATSNVLAKVSGITKTNASVYREARPGHGYCAKLVTHEERCVVLGVVNIKVLAAGSVFLGRTLEPITGTKNPMGKLDAGVRFTKRPTAVMFDYKVKLSGKANRVRQTGFGRVKTVAGKDLADCILYLQKRWEDKDGNIYAKRIGTMVKRFDRNTGWVNNASFAIHYGDITKQPFYRSYMGLTTGDVVKYARNSRGKMVPVHEVGWGSATDTPTHLVLQFDSSHGGAYVGSVGNTLWIDNVRLVY